MRSIETRSGDETSHTIAWLPTSRATDNTISRDGRSASVISFGVPAYSRSKPPAVINRGGSRDGPCTGKPLRFDWEKKTAVEWNGQLDLDTIPGEARLCTAAMPHAGGRLFQQLLVDWYTRIEGERLEWVHRNQPLLRCESLHGLGGLCRKASEASSGRIWRTPALSGGCKLS